MNWILVFALLLSSTSLWAQGTTNGSTTVCELLRKADGYEGHVVTLQATVLQGEYLIAVDTGCKGRVMLEPPEHTSQYFKRLINDLEYAKFEGLFDLDDEWPIPNHKQALGSADKPNAASASLTGIFHLHSESGGMDDHSMQLIRIRSVEPKIIDRGSMIPQYAPPATLPKVPFN